MIFFFLEKAQRFVRHRFIHICCYPDNADFSLSPTLKKVCCGITSFFWLFHFSFTWSVAEDNKRLTKRNPDKLGGKTLCDNTAASWYFSSEAGRGQNYNNEIWAVRTINVWTCNSTSTAISENFSPASRTTSPSLKIGHSESFPLWQLCR